MPPTRSTTTELDRSLARIAELLLLAHRDADGPTLVRIAPDDDDDGFQLGLLPVPRNLDPLDLVIGTDTPPEWAVLGVVFRGRIIDLAAAEGGAARRRPGGAAGCVLMRRDGSSVSVLRHGDEVTTIESDADSPMVGRYADALRRSLGLPTDPPEGGVGALAALVWLHRIHELALDGRMPDVEVVQALRPPLPRSWDDLRLQVAAGGWSELRCDPEVAAWMDEGIFSRACFAAFPEPEELVAELCELLPSDAGEVLVSGIQGWG